MMEVITVSGSYSVKKLFWVDDRAARLTCSYID